MSRKLTSCKVKRIAATGVLAAVMAISGCGSKADAAVAAGPAQTVAEVQQVVTQAAETTAQVLKNMYVTGDVVNVRKSPEQ